MSEAFLDKAKESDQYKYVFFPHSVNISVPSNSGNSGSVIAWESSLPVVEYHTLGGFSYSNSRVIPVSAIYRIYISSSDYRVQLSSGLGELSHPTFNEYVFIVDVTSQRYSSSSGPTIYSNSLGVWLFSFSFYYNTSSYKIRCEVSSSGVSYGGLSSMIRVVGFTFRYSDIGTF